MDQKTWNDGFRLGIRKIDEEHAIFLNILNSLEDAVAQGRGNQEVGKAINDLMLYAYNHFAGEEKLLRDYEYPDYERHMKIHEAATGNILELANTHQANSGNARQLVLVLTEWLINHIQGTDKKYAPYLIAKGVV
jgi:hemerythrin